MPNWCSNHLRIRGPEEDLARFKAAAIGYSPWLTAEEKKQEAPSCLNFHSLIPLPEAIIQAGCNGDAYDCELKLWGTKWGACNATLVDEDEVHLLYDFDTAWSPPVAFLKNVGVLWPQLVFLLDYDEMGNGFKGITRAEGESFEDHCVSY